MLFGQNRDELRRFYVTTWAKRRRGETLEGLEAQVAGVIEQHPEYHPLLADEDAAIGGEWHADSGDSNPFLHMGMHIAILEQLSTDRPAGLRTAYQGLMMKLGDAHAVEHRMMECLGRIMWEAQQSGREPDERAYLACIQSI